MINLKKLKITTISENVSTRVGLLGEWGISIFIDAGDKKILFDTGAGITASHNSEVLNINLKELDLIVLSHGHNDHTGGLYDILKKINKEIKILAHPSVWEEKYVESIGKKMRFAGIPFSRNSLESLGARFEYSSDPVWITDDIVASGIEPMTTSFESVNKTLFLKKNDTFIIDPVLDDQSLFIKSELGLIVILGCAHRGMINIIKYGQKITGIEKVHMVLGGTHLHKAEEEQLTETVIALKELNVERIGVSHCTGMKVSAKLLETFGPKFFFNNTGTIIEFPNAY